MIIYPNTINNDEMFSKIWDGPWVMHRGGEDGSKTEGNIDDSLICGNASNKGPKGEGTESTIITGVDIVMNHHLQETGFTEEVYKKYIKDDMKSIKGKLEALRPERRKSFMTEAAEQIKHIFAKISKTTTSLLVKT
ncbi:unnamed protein product [Gulo gulo]|uniref:Translationally-controlled tumor protein n=1 Tax=Gulo gulo TaxID=48420 RepID=A0A9X9LGM5_GULGU|nr:unnamed protein product [Gulo gulo]